MEEKIIELIEVVKNNSSSDNIIIICTTISCLVALVSLIISIYLCFIQTKDRLIRKKVLGYVYNYYAPAYEVEKLPTTKQIQSELRCLFISKKDVFDTLVSLNNDGAIQAVGDLETTQETIRWKPNTKYSK